MPMRRWIASTGLTTKKNTAAAIETNAISAFFLFYAQQYLQVTYRTAGDFGHQNP